MSTIDYHYQTMGRILSHLIQQGFKRVDFDTSDAMDIMAERHGDEEEVLETFADLLYWMRDQGFIRVASIQEFEGGFAFSGVQLTSKGVAAIQAKPNDPELGESIEKKVNDNGCSLAAFSTSFVRRNPSSLRASGRRKGVPSQMRPRPVASVLPTRFRGFPRLTRIRTQRPFPDRA